MIRVQAAGFEVLALLIDIVLRLYRARLIRIVS